MSTTATTTTSEYPIYECAPIRPPLVMMERTIKWKPNNIELAPNCPRCASSNTKFCYYNNYSVSQPRYFCKACRRYWTKGGSLRNVPVGGGCRKSRRTRATRQDGGTNYPVGSRCVESANESESGSDIDLAAVFAKYVNQNVENDESCGAGASFASSDNVKASSLDIDSQIEDAPLFEYRKPVDLISGADDQLQQGHEYVDGQDFVYQNCNAFELEGILGTEVAGDMLWSEGTNLPSFGSQQSMLHLQDFEIFSPDDQLRISANLANDNWGSFDLSGYEIFTRP
ncbi:hypothetical protein Pfo_017162 [Paulownia fortunei]|nr:hypothetical protein Pfo_017162 [Paulownia fortunei]